jgi:hypothetical protein
MTVCRYYAFVLWDADVAVGVIRVDVQDEVAIFRHGVGPLTVSLLAAFRRQ